MNISGESTSSDANAFDRVPSGQLHSVVTGGAGFLGSHLVTSLLGDGRRVTVVDDLSTGSFENLAHLDTPHLEVVVADISEGLSIDSPVDEIYHMASPASPPAYLARRVATLRTGSAGTDHVLELALANEARVLFASTSEIYGDPLEHPQTETYWGNVNSIGPRSCYDEAKRYAEALAMAHHHELGTDVRIVRIFNTYGPRLSPGDGRVVSNFLSQALAGEPLTIYGDGSQTRSFCFVDDLIRGIRALFHSDLVAIPVNLGDPHEMTVADLAELAIEVTGSDSKVEYLELPIDDPTRRRPDITRATELLGWTPSVCLRDGLKMTAAWLMAQNDSV
ncbi:MAG TPA: UDP-glucuronic acid decarboxylase family protein [Microthrixaceae bacterium]|nr:UDP-glucuronic acid decarboxylase family protein [Microthrixaceae bacterium]